MRSRRRGRQTRRECRWGRRWRGARCMCSTRQGSRCRWGGRAAVAALQPGAGGQPQLVAYVVPAGPADEAAWRSYLAARLAAYMVPAVFVALAALPRTAHGKVDRRALPVPAAAVSAAVAPRTPTEATLATIWAG